MRLAALWILLASFALTGCVERRIYIYSDPPGADVYIDGELVGQTRPDDHEEGPFYVNFVYYGKRDYTLRMPGRQPVSGTIDLEVPWYEYPPVDFFAEVLAPWVIVDSHEIRESLDKAQPFDMNELLNAAEAYRESARPQDRYEIVGAWRTSDVQPSPQNPESSAE